MRSNEKMVYVTMTAGSDIRFFGVLFFNECFDPLAIPLICSFSQVPAWHRHNLLKFAFLSLFGIYIG